MTATLRLTRQGNGIELRRGTFEVEVDDASVASIEWHATVEVPVEPGRHGLRVRKGRYASRSRSFEAEDGELIRFRCHGGDALAALRRLASPARSGHLAQTRVRKHP